MLKKFYKVFIAPYTLYVLYLMFLGMGRYQFEDNIVRLEPVFSTIRFIEGTISWKDIVVLILGNVIMFIPFGFLGWAFPRLIELKSLVFTFMSAITIAEGLQYFTRMGVFEVDDIILNTFGVYIGWRICKWIERKLSV
ncbi:glycopeptide antibiotics resistance protein [Chryseobacterium defluvii]|uniref:Glycopeptide antibiotics resistance protein n=1 Tax=Chryseobacterium defluvii TaxID=160396 RepID=A0A840KAB9_9FLAO|nr:VanZ family protein [Chryseobacterium defluvii]MBB4806319.1 glycopeptide antibiotics resistance protein [Chryseobacterium defluvii]